MARTLRRLIGFTLFAAYMWFFWDLFRRFDHANANTLPYWVAMASCFVLLGIGAWLFDKVWPPKRGPRN